MWAVSVILQFWQETDKAAYLLRQYFFHNLHDRLSTRPFLSLVEKKWLAFQVFSLVHFQLFAYESIVFLLTSILFWFGVIHTVAFSCKTEPREGSVSW
jgi:hypothetical protein